MLRGKSRKGNGTFTILDLIGKPVSMESEIVRVVSLSRIKTSQIT